MGQGSPEHHWTPSLGLSEKLTCTTCPVCAKPQVLWLRQIWKENPKGEAALLGPKQVSNHLNLVHSSLQFPPSSSSHLSIVTKDSNQMTGFSLPGAFEDLRGEGPLRT